MFNKISNAKIGVRIYSGFGLVVSLLVLVATISIWSFTDTKSTFTAYRAIARDTNLVGRLQANMLMTRLGVKDFVISGSEDSIASVQSRLAKTKEFLEQAEVEINDPTRAQGIAKIAASIGKYEQGFADVLKLQEQRHVDVGILNDLGPALRLDLTEVMESAFRDDDASSAYLAGKTQQSYLLARLYVQKFLIQNDAESAQRAKEELLLTVDDGRVLVSSLENPKRLELARHFLSGVQEYAASFDSVVETIFARNTIISGTLDTLGPQIATIVEDVKLSVKEEQDTLGPQAIAAIDFTVMENMILALVSVIVAIAAAIWITRGISRPIIRITDTMKSLADGKVDVQVPFMERRDEVGAMAQAVNVFKDNAVKRLEFEAQNEREAAEKERRAQQIERLISDFDQQATTMISDLASSSTEMDQTANQLTELASTSAETAAAAAATTEQTSSNVQSVAAATEEIDKTVADIVQQMAKSQSMTEEARNDADTAREQVNALIETSQSIERVIEFINTIAEQTNLLALNATIEAARAGDAGRGFAVVASEVKALASQTSSATADIERDIDAMRTVSSKADQSMRAVCDAIQQVATVATTIAGAMEEQGATTSEIARNTGMAASGSQDVLTAIGDVTQKAQHTGQASQSVLDASRVIAERTEAMGGQIQTFLSEIKAV